MNIAVESAMACDVLTLCSEVTSMMIDSNQTLGHVAAEHPASTLVFLRHRLDFCCGGGQRLGDACRHVGLDPAAVIQEIEAEGATRSPERWDTKPLPELIDFIVSEYHEGLREDLPALVEAARRVERVHGKKAPMNSRSTWPRKSRCCSPRSRVDDAGLQCTCPSA